MRNPKSSRRKSALLQCGLVGLALLLSASLLSARAFAAEPARFCVAGDNRGHMGFTQVVQKIKAVPAPPQFIIFTGDQDPNTVTRAQLDAVFGKTFPWYPVVGNHEVEAEHGADMEYLRQFYDKQLAGKVNPGPAGTRQTTYSFDAGDVHIVILNQYWNGKAEPGSDCATTEGEIIRPLRDWLRADLAASRKPWKLVCAHTPVFFQSDKDLGTARGGTNDTFLNEDWKAFWAVLEEQGVAAYLCSHTHRYSRFRPVGSKVWQIDVAQARGDASWQNDAFVIVTATAQSLEFQTYRNLKEQGKFEVTDSLSLKATGAR